MKRKKIYFYSILAIFSSLTVTLDGFGQGKTLEKSYRWKYDVDESVNFTFNNYDCDLTIHTWANPVIEYKLSVDATTGTEEDAAILDRYLGNLEFSHMAGRVVIDSRFWSSQKSTRNKKTMTLKGGKTIQLVDFRIKGEVWIP
jgi:hypothetical protein